MIGAFLGWKPALMTIMVGSLLGSLVGLPLSQQVIKREDYIPFGPFLVCGALVAHSLASLSLIGIKGSWLDNGSLADPPFRTVSLLSRTVSLEVLFLSTIISFH